MAIPIGILAFTSSAIFVIVQSINWPFNCAEIFTLLFLIITLGLIIRAGILLTKSYFNYVYSYIATSQELKKYREELIQSYKNSENPTEKADADLEEYINSQYAEHTHKNIYNNDLKATYIHKANGYMIVSIITALISGVPYVANIIINPTEPQKIEIITHNNIKDKIMAEEEKPKPANQEDSETQKKPSPPPGRLVRESEYPKKNQ